VLSGDFDLLASAGTDWSIECSQGTFRGGCSCAEASDIVSTAQSTGAPGVTSRLHVNRRGGEEVHGAAGGGTAR